jgi:hypothetical protein
MTPGLVLNMALCNLGFKWYWYIDVGYRDVRLIWHEYCQGCTVCVCGLISCSWKYGQYGSKRGRFGVLFGLSLTAQRVVYGIWDEEEKGRSSFDDDDSRGRLTPRISDT